MVSVINDRYHIIKKLGEGGMGEVYLVEDSLRNFGKFALKVISEETITKKSSINTFKREFVVMTRLRHPNLIRVYDFGYDDHQKIYYLTMEYLTGGDLTKWISGHTLISVNAIIKIIVDAARTLEFIHSRKILHRDIKPSNIMMTKDNKIKVVDFGLADLGEAKEGLFKGTPAYIAPEVINGQPDIRTDIFALGTTFYELLTGQAFYQEIDLTEVSSSRSADVMEILNFLGDKSLFKRNYIKSLEKIPQPGLQKIISKMVAYDPQDRFSSCADIILTINRYQNKSYPLETNETREAYVLGSGFIGRKDEFKKLRDWYNNSDAKTKVLLVYGETGIGKSRLFQEFRYYCQVHNIKFFESNCFEQINNAYLAFLVILREILMHASDTLINHYGSHLKQIFPTHQRLQSYSTNFIDDPERSRRILIEKITCFILDYAQEKNEDIILYFNDFQWADDASIEALNELLFKCTQDEYQNHHLRIYMSMRIEDQGQIKSILKHAHERDRLQPLKLRTFNEHYVHGYINAIFNKENIGKSLKKAVPIINQKVGGNPFFLQELIKSLVELNIIQRNRHEWTLEGDINTAEIPTNLKNLIGLRLKNVISTDHDLRILQILALLQYYPTYDELNQILKTSFEFLMKLEKLEIIKSEIIENNMVYRLNHDLIAGVVIDEHYFKGKVDLKRLNLYIAERLETIHFENIESYVQALANHYSAADYREKAIPYLEKAIVQTKQNYQNKLAIKFHDQLLKYQKKYSPEYIKTLLEKGKLLKLIGQWDDAEEIYQQAIKQAEESKKVFEIVRSNRRMGELLFLKGKDDAAMEYFKKSLMYGESIMDDVGTSITMGRIGQVYLRKGEYDKAQYYFQKDVMICTGIDDIKGISYAYGNLGNLYWLKGEFDYALDFYSKQLELLIEIDDQTGLSNTYKGLGNVFWRKGNYNEAIKFYQKGLEVSKKLGDRRSTSAIYGQIGTVLSEKGEYDDALYYLKQWLKIARELGDREGMATVARLIGAVYRKKGDYHQAIIWLEEKALKLNEALHNNSEIPNVVYNIACTYQSLGDYDLAISYFQRGLKLREEMKDKNGVAIFCGQMATLYAALKKYDSALHYMDRAISLSREIGIRFWLSGFLIQKAEILFELKQYQDARQLNEEGMAMVKTVNNNRFIFRGEVLAVKINLILKNTNEDIGHLYQLLEKYDNDQEQAALNYEIWKIMLKLDASSAARHATVAIKLYEQLYKQSPHILYKNRIEELDQ